MYRVIKNDSLTDIIRRNYCLIAGETIYFKIEDGILLIENISISDKVLFSQSLARERIRQLVFKDCEFNQEFVSTSSHNIGTLIFSNCVFNDNLNISGLTANLKFSDD